MSTRPDTAFTWNDTVRVIPTAPLECRPGAGASVVGFSAQDERSGAFLARYPEGTVYSIEFEDGSDAQVEERFLVREIVLDASRWRTADDFYSDLLAELQAPEWHGRNFDALHDSIIVGGINGVEPPFTVTIRGKAPVLEAARVLEHFVELIREAADEGRPVTLTAEE